MNAAATSRPIPSGFAAAKTSDPAVGRGRGFLRVPRAGGALEDAACPQFDSGPCHHFWGLHQRLTTSNDGNAATLADSGNCETSVWIFIVSFRSLWRTASITIRRYARLKTRLPPNATRSACEIRQCRCSPHDLRPPLLHQPLKGRPRDRRPAQLYSLRLFTGRTRFPKCRHR